MKNNIKIIKEILLCILINWVIIGRLFANDGKQPPPMPTVVLTAPSGVNSLNCYATVTASGCGANAVHWYSGSTFLSSVNPYQVKYDTRIDVKAACFDGTALGSFSPEYKALSYMAAELLPSGNICSNGTSLLLNASTSASGFNTYYWYKNGTSIAGSGSNIPSYNVTSSGSYTLFTGKGFCYGTTAPANVTFITTPIVNTSFSGACGDQTVTMTTQTLPVGTFQWKLNNVPISGATSSSYATSIEGTYQVEYTYQGCSETSFPYIFIQSIPPSITLEPPLSVSCSAFINATGCSNEVRWYKDVSGVWTFVTTGNKYTFPVTATPSDYRATCKKGNCETAPSNVLTAYPHNYVSITPNGGAYCANSFLSLQAITPNSGLTYDWRKIGVAINLSSSQTYNATSAGQYAVLVTDGGNCPYTSQAVTVSAVGNVVPTISTGAVTGACGSQSVMLTVTNISPGTYQWKLNGIAMSGITGTTYTATASGSYSVELTQGACTAVSSAYKFNTPPIIFLSEAVSPSCNNTLSAINSVGTLRWYKSVSNSWILDNTGSNPYSFLPNNVPPDYRATNEMNGCETPPSNVVTAIPYLFATISPNPIAYICSSVGSVLLSTNSTYTGLGYQWKLNATNISNANSSTYSATSTGNYQIVTTKGICSFNSAVVTASNSSPPTISISSTVPNPATIVNGQSLTLTANGCAGGIIQWSNSEGTSSIVVSPPVGTTTYTFICTKQNCTATSGGFVINVNTLQPPSISASSLYTCASINDTLIASGCPNGGVYTWNTIPTQTGSSIIINPLITTGYVVNCTLGAVVSGNSPTVIITVNATITSKQSGNWNHKATWSCNCIPDVCNNIIVQTGHNVTIPQTIPTSYIAKLKNLTLKGTINNQNTSTLKLN
jgi:hypothetical protein